MVYPVWVGFGLYMKGIISVCLVILLINFESLAFQERDTKQKIVSNWCYETTFLYQCLDEKNELANQSSNVQYIHEMKFEEELKEISVENAVAYEKLFHTVKYADVTMVECSEQKQRKALG